MGALGQPEREKLNFSTAFFAVFFIFTGTNLGEIVATSQSSELAFYPFNILQ